MKAARIKMLKGHWGTKWIALALLVSLLWACQSPTEDLSDVISLHETSAMELLDGTTGSTVTLTALKDIEAIQSFLSPMRVEKMRFAEQTEGYRFRLTLKNGDTEKDTIVFLGNLLEINGEVYEVEKYVDSSFFESYFQE